CKPAAPPFPLPPPPRLRPNPAALAGTASGTATPRENPPARPNAARSASRSRSRAAADFPKSKGSAPQTCLSSTLNQALLSPYVVTIYIGKTYVKAPGSASGVNWYGVPRQWQFGVKAVGAPPLCV